MFVRSPSDKKRVRTAPPGGIMKTELVDQLLEGTPREGLFDANSLIAAPTS